MRIGVALLDNTAGGTAQIGVLNVLTRQGVKIDTISGYKSGAVIAALYGAGCTPKEIENVFLAVDKKNIFSNLFRIINIKRKNLSNITNYQIVEKAIKLLKEKGIENISDLKMPVFLISEEQRTSNRIIYASRENMFIKGRKIITKTSIAIKDALYSISENSNLDPDFNENSGLPLIYPMNCIGLESLLILNNYKSLKQSEAFKVFTLFLASDDNASLKDNILTGENEANKLLNDILLSLYLK